MAAFYRARPDVFNIIYTNIIFVSVKIDCRPLIKIAIIFRNGIQIAVLYFIYFTEAIAPALILKRSNNIDIAIIAVNFTDIDIMPAIHKLPFIIFDIERFIIAVTYFTDIRLFTFAHGLPLH